MNKNLYNFEAPNISSELLQPFTQIIPSGIEVFAKENNLSLDDATALFEKKLQGVTIKTFNVEDITLGSSEEEQQLLFKMGLTKCKVNPDRPNEPATKIIYINDSLLANPAELKSTFIHEIFHTVLSADELTFKNGQHTYSMGCSETTFENGSCTGTKAHMLHEVLVARMEKRFCKKEGIPFIEYGLFASGYADGIRRLEKFERLTGCKLSPNASFDSLKIIFGDKLEVFSTLLDTGDYSRCDDFLVQLQNQKSPLSKLRHSFLNLAQQANQKIKNLFKPKNKIPMLEEGIPIYSKSSISEESSFTPLKQLSPKQKFEHQLSNNGEFKHLPPLNIQPNDVSDTLHQEQLQNTDEVTL